MIRIVIVIASLSICFITSSAQDKILISNFTIIDEDTIFTSNIPEVEILSFKNKDERNKYYILKRRVLKVYPYALVAKKKLYEIEQAIDTMPKKRHKKRHTREVTKWVKQEYTEQLKNLTMSEGKILVKLIYRETKTSSYEIVKAYRGIFNAFFWQTMARLWDNNLKTEYDPVNVREDMLIEHILIQAKLEGKFD